MLCFPVAGETNIDSIASLIVNAPGILVRWAQHADGNWGPRPIYAQYLQNELWSERITRKKLNEPKMLGYTGDVKATTECVIA